ncbi:NAD(P)H-dependent flavin oxidoreductase [Bremerella cremea]
MNTLLTQLSIPLPIIQAPMAGVSTVELNVAVSSAGGLGSIGIGNLDVDASRMMIRSVRERSDRPFNVNLFCHRPATEDPVRQAAWIERLRPHFANFDCEPPQSLREIYTSFVQNEPMLEMLLEERPPIVSFHFGLPPSSTIAALKQAGTVLLATATNLEEAQAIAAAGIDAVVAQGYEAGGHRGIFDTSGLDTRLGTLPLTRQLASQLSIPVIAAGGIMEGTDIAEAMQAGASAVQLGTAFLLCPEAATDAGYRQRLQSNAAHETVMTNTISGRPARSLPNVLANLCHEVEASQVPDYPIAYDAGKALNAAAKSQGNFDYGAHWAGQGSPRLRSLPAAELVQRLHQEMTSGN